MWRTTIGGSAGSLIPKKDVDTIYASGSRHCQDCDHGAKRKNPSYLLPTTPHHATARMFQWASSEFPFLPGFYMENVYPIITFKFSPHMRIIDMPSRHFFNIVHRKMYKYNLPKTETSKPKFHQHSITLTTYLPVKLASRNTLP